MEAPSTASTSRETLLVALLSQTSPGTWTLSADLLDGKVAQGRRGRTRQGLRGCRIARPSVTAGDSAAPLALRV